MYDSCDAFPGRLETLAADLGEAVTVQTDMRDPAQIRRMIERAVSAYGTVDVLVNNASQGLAPQTPEEVAEAIVDLVITGAESAVLVPDQLRQR